MKIATVKPELCVCGHEDAGHSSAGCYGCDCTRTCGVVIVDDPVFAAADAERVKAWADHVLDVPGRKIFAGSITKPTEVMATVDGWPGVKVTTESLTPPPDAYACMSVFGSTPVSQCQADWPGIEEVKAADRACLSAYESVAKFEEMDTWPYCKLNYDLLDKKPNRPNEPLPDCPGSCTEPEYAHRENVVCSSDESRRLIE